jgi:hypothetical protein
MRHVICAVLVIAALVGQFALGQVKSPTLNELRIHSLVFVNDRQEEVARLQSTGGHFQMWVRDQQGKGGVLIDGERLAISVVGKQGKPAAFLAADDSGNGILGTFSNQHGGGVYVGVDENGGAVGITNIHGNQVLSVEANQTDGAGRVRISDSREKPRIALTVVDDNPVMLRLDRDGNQLPSLY